MNNSKVILIILFFLIGCNSTAEKRDIVVRPFDNTYASLAEVLSNYAIGERFDYRTLKENRTGIDNFIGELAGLTKEEYDKMTDPEKKAMWINAYNGITLRSIIDHYPVKSIKDIEGVWDKTNWSVAGRDVTLDEIEHKILRVDFPDAKIHFAVNCASIGCPPLLNKPFMPETLNMQLDEVTKLFLNNPIRNIVDTNNNLITTSQIFQWFGNDFIKYYSTHDFNHLSAEEQAVLNFIFTYTDHDNIDKNANWKFDYTPYDWGLNDIVR